MARSLLAGSGRSAISAYDPLLPVAL